MEFEIERARRLYAEGRGLIPLLTSARARVAFEFAVEAYSGILEKSARPGTTSSTGAPTWGSPRSWPSSPPPRGVPAPPRSPAGAGGAREHSAAGARRSPARGTRPRGGLGGGGLPLPAPARRPLVRRARVEHHHHRGVRPPQASPRPRARGPEGRHRALRLLAPGERRQLGIGEGLPGDVSTTVESYLALRLLGLPVDDERMRRAEQRIRELGGSGACASSRASTWPSSACSRGTRCRRCRPRSSSFPAGAPSTSTGSRAGRAARWSHSSSCSTTVRSSRSPTAARPRTTGSITCGWIPARKRVPYRPSVLASLRADGPGWKALFNAGDALLRLHDGVRDSRPAVPGSAGGALRV